AGSPTGMAILILLVTRVSRALPSCPRRPASSIHRISREPQQSRRLLDHTLSRMVTAGYRMQPCLQPRHQRSVDHIGHALAADRFNRLVDLVEAEPVSGDELQREALGGKLLQRQLAGLV